jgi:hypothetical protein
MNGTIARSINLVGVPKQNYGDVFVAMNGGMELLLIQTDEIFNLKLQIVVNL